MDENKIDVEQIRRLAITKQLNFLIGSGCSQPAIPLMNQIDKEDIDERNKELESIISKKSDKLLNGDFKLDGDIGITLKNYIKFLTVIIELLNLSNSRQTPRSTNVFTTNYDLFIEKAIDNLSIENRFVFNDGANGYFKRYLDNSNYNRFVSYKGLNENYIDEIPSVNLIKPHGSINWEKDNDYIFVKNEISECPAIVKPTGIEGQETFLNNHFHDMLRIFQLELDKAQSILLIIGFSFQDKHISKMIKRALQNPELMVFVFGYCDGDREVYLKNLNMQNEKYNFKILTPKDFDEKFLTETEKNGERVFCFTINNLTNILSLDKFGGEQNEKSK